MSKSGGTFGIGTIIFLVVAYNFLFDDDENEIEVIDKVKNVIVKTKEIIIETKDSEGVQEIINKAKEKLKLDKETDEEETEVAEVKEEKTEEEKKISPPPQILPSEPKEEQPQTEEFEKL